MKLYLVRHGEAEEAWLPAMGHADPPLSALGRRQADAIAGELADVASRGDGFAGVYSSPLRATAETAETIAHALTNVAPQLTEALSTLTPEELPAGDAGVEPLAALQARAWALVESLRETHDFAASLVLVSHALPLRALICRALGMGLEDAFRFDLAPASLTTLEFRRAPNGDLRTLIAGLNESCYLDEAGVAGS